MASSTRALRDALLHKSAPLTEAALSDHGLNDEVYELYERPVPSTQQKALLIVRLHELLAREGGEQEIEQAVRDGRLRALLGKQFAWVLPIFEAED